MQQDQISSFKEGSTVLILDSGVGGLSIYNEIRILLPHVHYIYFFDNMGFPYGEKSEQFIIDRILSIVLAITNMYAIALVVIACNSASIVTLPSVRSRFLFPVVGVVPAIKPAVKLSRNSIIGLLATRRTIECSYTHQLVSRFSGECRIEMLAAMELVDLVENKLHGFPISIEKIRLTLQPWLSMRELPDTIVLGCTHFSFILMELKQVLPQGTVFIDSAMAIARRTAWFLENGVSIPISGAKNVALCMKITSKSIRLIPMLRYFGFENLRTLKL
ncbi:glutamate racemase [Candidatus Erwinia haradaeae]|uniref:Glutamate racemase n=1 Tax=Candidatus Erwinia haradaeae TaxID=1922217 RepID=A0A451D8P5_9GAMM|nr:glutamate racemase [Candidatus Erwinia haradaeae]VFP82219.1 Glutamate racemase [Candidatus Erwinia haradaeae]